MLIQFWRTHDGYGFHPHDKASIPQRRVVRWTVDEALDHQGTFGMERHLHPLVHENLFPWPFVGNPDRASVVILTGNPGFTVTDYLDEYRTPAHQKAWAANLGGKGDGFFVLREQSAGTGGYRYWHRRFQSLVRDVSLALSVSQPEALEIVIRETALLEAGAYHSKSSPGRWFDMLPSSQAARRYVHERLLPRAHAGGVLVFVWRRAALWDIPDETPGVIFRPPTQAVGSYFYADERAAMAAQIVRSVG